MYNSGPLGVILLVDDDTNITDLLKFNLGSEGFGVAVVAKAKDVETNAIGDIRLVIADAMDQPFSGFDLIEAIKENPVSAHVPVIVCTQSEGEDDIIRAFECGADDYVSKPFSLRELIARIKAVLRRHPRRVPVEKKAAAAPSLMVPSLNLQIDTASQRVMEDGIVVPLTKTEYAILVFLLRNQNTFYTRNEICVEVWKDDTGSNARIVDTNISRLRKKLGESGKYIINRYGMGYAFVDKLA